MSNSKLVTETVTPQSVLLSWDPLLQRFGVLYPQAQTVVKQFLETVHPYLYTPELKSLCGVYCQFVLTPSAAEEVGPLLEQFCAWHEVELGRNALHHPEDSLMQYPIQGALIHLASSNLPNHTSSLRRS